MKSAVHIRPLLARDLCRDSGLVQCLREAMIAMEQQLVAAMPWHSFLRAVEKRTQSGVRVWVADTGQEIVGCVSLVVPPADAYIGKRVAYVEDVAVRPGWRRYGFGRRLVERAVEAARGLGVAECLLSCRPDLASWYAEQGWKPVTDLTAMRLPLKACPAPMGSGMIDVEEGEAD